LRDAFVLISPNAPVLDQLAGLVEASKLPLVGGEFALQNIADAHALREPGRAVCIKVPAHYIAMSQQTAVRGMMDRLARFVVPGLPRHIAERGDKTRRKSRDKPTATAVSLT
jgi:hypothetical protein